MEISVDERLGCIEYDYPAFHLLMDCFWTRISCGDLPLKEHEDARQLSKEVLCLMNRFSEKDWKLFRSKIAGWQEAYIDKLNKEYIELLSAQGNASDKFWTLEKRIREDKKDCGVQCEMSRSNQFYIMMSLLNEGAITLEDLDEFSDDLKDIMKHFWGRR